MKAGSLSILSRAALVLAASATALALGAPRASAQDADRAFDLYRTGRFDEAYTVFTRLAEDVRSENRDQWIPALDYNRGNALYRLGRYAEAAARFRAALAGRQNLRQRSDFNLGNALFGAAVETTQHEGDKRKMLRQAISAYERALLHDASDRDAKWNLELALRALENEERWQGMPLRREGPGAGAGNNPETQGGQTAGLAAPGPGGGAMHGVGQGAEALDSVPELTLAEARELLRTARLEQARPDRRPQLQAGRGPFKNDW